MMTTHHVAFNHIFRTHRLLGKQQKLRSIVFSYLSWTVRHTAVHHILFSRQFRGRRRKLLSNGWSRDKLKNTQILTNHSFSCLAFCIYWDRSRTCG